MPNAVTTVLQVRAHSNSVARRRWSYKFVPGTQASQAAIHSHTHSEVKAISSPAQNLIKERQAQNQN